MSQLTILKPVALETARADLSNIRSQLDNAQSTGVNSANVN
jgi:hypothetical protein